MNSVLIALAAAAADPVSPPDEPDEPPPGEAEIVVTGRSLGEAPSTASVDSAAAVRVIPALSERAGLPMLIDYLRLVPSASVTSAGPRGSQAQVRLRGAEANHTLLVIDGIRFNDPAAGNEARWELLSQDFAVRSSVDLGPHSALWGSEAIGGVVAADTLDPYSDGEGFGGRAEYGSLDTARAGAWIGAYAGPVRLAATGGWMRSDGIDSFSGSGDRDGFENRSASLRLVFRPGERYARLHPLELGAVSHWVEGESEYDGFDPVTFRRADTLDSTRNRIGAVRGWAKAESGGWTLTFDGSLLSSANRNFLAGAPLNRTFGRRFTTSARLARRIGGHELAVAADYQAERFRARDEVFFGATRQNRSRELTAFVGQWDAEWSRRLTTLVAVRHDRFSAFGNATTLRAGITAEPVRRLQLVAAYGEGIAQPTFYDLYGFFPGSFAGNPALRPERSHGWHAGLRLNDWRNLRAELFYFRSTLKDEIVDVFDPATFLSTTVNATGTSRRQGIDAVVTLHPRSRTVERLFVTYSWLDAQEQQIAGGLAVREVRRPRHRAGFGAQGALGDLSWGATLAYVGARRDTDFDAFPPRPVRLGAYWLGSLQLNWRFTEGLEAFARVQNALDEDYQDVFGYRTEGRTVHAGIRARFRD